MIRQPCSSVLRSGGSIQPSLSWSPREGSGFLPDDSSPSPSPPSPSPSPPLLNKYSKHLKGRINILKKFINNKPVIVKNIVPKQQKHLKTILAGTPMTALISALYLMAKHKHDCYPFNADDWALFYHKGVNYRKWCNLELNFIIFLL